MQQDPCTKCAQQCRKFRPSQGDINMAFIGSTVSGGESLKGWAGTKVPALFFCPLCVARNQRLEHPPVFQRKRSSQGSLRAREPAPARPGKKTVASLGPTRSSAVFHDPPGSKEKVESGSRLRTEPREAPPQKCDGAYSFFGNAQLDISDCENMKAFPSRSEERRVGKECKIR